MRDANEKQPTVYIIAGPNGAGKTTFALEFLPKVADCRTFINADYLARGLSPLDADAAAMDAGRLFLRQIRSVMNGQKNFAFETTLSGSGYIRLFHALREKGYAIHLYFLWIPSLELALKRIAERVRRGGHDIPKDVATRRYGRGLSNLFSHYMPLADYCAIFDNLSANMESERKLQSQGPCDIGVHGLRRGGSRASAGRIATISPRWMPQQETLQTGTRMQAGMSIPFRYPDPGFTPAAGSRASAGRNATVSPRWTPQQAMPPTGTRTQTRRFMLLRCRVQWFTPGALLQTLAGMIVIILLCWIPQQQASQLHGTQMQVVMFMPLRFLVPLFTLGVVFGASEDSREPVLPSLTSYIVLQNSLTIFLANRKALAWTSIQTWLLMLRM